ncbi:hypothetical protein V0U79_09155 [Hyphobacterium sp. HN65]|uniref:Tetratricopeptide repeat protein n=1 Tax=Hyphobacterium lacteum TaxID=3116575 RepID=A0ABU7LRJ0_9PROT|nr:hypothetical protein [Hyphobacterium sp. HN65]MEE2526533.1 hypothetical protein [Hyphobacterium sp. HN65]
MIRSIVALCLLSSAAFAQDAPEPLAPYDTSYSLRHEAERAAEAGDFEAARRAMQAALGLQPGSPAVLFGMAQLGIASGNDELVLTALEDVAAAGIHADLSRLGETAERLRADYPDRYGAIETAIAANGTPVGRAERALRVDVPGSLIEGVAVEIETDRFFLSDVVGRRVLVVEPFDRASAHVFADAEDGLYSPFGIVSDDVNRVIWVASGVLPQTPLEEGEEAGTALLALDLVTGDLYRRYEADGAERFADLVTRDGMVWLVDSGANRIYTLSSLSGSLRVLSEDPRFASLQGAALADGALYVADYALGLWRVDLADGTAQLVQPANESLLGIDGLAATRDGRLIAVRNGVNPNAVMAIDLGSDGLAVAATEILVRGHADFGEPTLLDVQDDRIFFIANAPWALWPEDGSGPTQTVPPLVVLEYDLD